MGFRHPVLLIHGINDTEAVFHSMSRHLTRLGYSVYSLSLTPNNGHLGLEHLAAQVSNYVARTFAPEQHFDLVGFSMGGIVSRYYVQRLGGIAQVKRFVTIASPHQGTWLAYGSERPGCVQMRPGSAFLQDLNQDAEILKQLHFTSIWTPLDLMIVPANSSLMPVGQSVPVWVPSHAWMVSHPQSLQAVASCLQTPLKGSGSNDRPPEQSLDRQRLPLDGSRT
ncbi:lipase [Trichocoleus sp. FACHB-591]|uniref:esterase/lipase family protein n=1 Tax=Trichocoleus sp. FACHB-591 TaxID=2692872 RepID=UPI001688317A|nr:alpha/beta fold hydrolase [Trichocoleus sp. FACHB-591]MBD2097774.1 lipase [Trichocoleus sp. FACHB-591]